MARETEQETGPAFDDRYGHHWKEPERVQEYVARTDREAEERAESFKVMVGLVPFELTYPVRVFDIGSGHGAVAAALLDAFPNAHAVGLDVSEPMMAIGRDRMARYGDRFRYHVGDFADGELPDDLPGPFDVAVSSRAIHHLPPEQKRLLYQAVFRSLTPGGCFFNLDTVAPSDEYLKALYRQAGDFLRGRPLAWTSTQTSRPPSPGHYFDTVEDHLRFLAEAGFAPVDCFWKRLNNALIGGYKRG